MTNKTEIADFVARYVAVWNEPDPEARRAAVHALWAADGAQYLEETQFEGHRAIEVRIAEAHDEFVAGEASCSGRPGTRPGTTA